MALSIAEQLWMEELIKSYKNDAQCKDIIAKLVLDPDAQPPYQLVEGILKYKGKIYVGSSNDLRLQLLQTLHSSAIGGHLDKEDVGRELNQFSIGQDSSRMWSTMCKLAMCAREISLRTSLTRDFYNHFYCFNSSIFSKENDINNH